MGGELSIRRDELEGQGCADSRPSRPRPERGGSTDIPPAALALRVRAVADL